jgi:hypothetical protein
VFAGVLNDEDARRATDVIEAVLAHDIRCALTGGLAIDAQLRKHGRPGERRSLNDIDFVVEDFASIPESLAGAFLQHHVHPDANDGRTLLQLVDEPRAIRIDLFRALGGSLLRASKLPHETGVLDVLSVEDLIARNTAFVCGRLRRGETIDGKHAVAFSRLRGLGQPERLAAAWNDHRRQVPGTLKDASREAVQLLEAHPELIIVEEYSSTPVACGRCRAHGAFRPAPLETIVETLGYC